MANDMYTNLNQTKSTEYLVIECPQSVYYDVIHP